MSLSRLASVCRASFEESAVDERRGAIPGRLEPESGPVLRPIDLGDDTKKAGSTSIYNYVLSA
jgi:hypothetical protein